MARIMKFPKSHIITVAWLNHLQILVIDKKSDFKRLVKEFRLKGSSVASDWTDANGSIAVLERDGTTHFVFIFPTKDDRVIVHESVHMAQAITDHKGIPVTAVSEVLAYLTDYLYSEITTLWRLKKEES